MKAVFAAAHTQLAQVCASPALPVDGAALEPGMFDVSEQSRASQDAPDRTVTLHPAERAAQVSQLNRSVVRCISCQTQLHCQEA